MEPTRAKYEQLIQDLRAELRPQREWSQGRGIFMVIGHFVVGVAGGTWLFSLLYGSRLGLTLAFALGGLGGLLHLANLGHPGRAWKMALQFRHSWISRGFFGLSLFLAGGFLYLVPLWLPGALWGSDSVIAGVGKTTSILGMVTIIGYMGFVYTASKGIPFWNSPLHPALYVAYALRGGIAGLLLAQAVGGEWLASLNSLLFLWSGITAIVILFFGLEVHGALTSGNAAAQRSVRELFAGSGAIYFYGGTLLLGLLIPAWFVWTGLSGPVSAGAMTLLAIASAIGDFFMKYSTIRAGVYLPVWTSSARNGNRLRKGLRNIGA
jgi:formate-dependent nitrite reductase membrane component NrfD